MALAEPTRGARVMLPGQEPPRVILRSAWAVAVALAVVLPALVWILGWRALDAEATLLARITATHLGEHLAHDPSLWRPGAPHLARLVGDDQTRSEAEIRRVEDSAGVTLLDVGTLAAGPRIERSAPVLDAQGQVAGRFVVERSLADLLAKTGLAGIGGLALGVALFVLLRLLPLSVLEGVWRSLRVEREKSRLIFEHARDGMMSVDGALNVEAFNTAAQVIFGREADAVVGRSIQTLFVLDDESTFRQRLGAPTEEVMEISGLRGDGSRFPAEVSISRLDDEGTTRYIMVVRDITERKRAEAELAFMANYDALTGLPNRSLFADRLEQALRRADRHRSSVALMFIDLDHFKTINDTLGHAIGDRLLALVAARMVQALRQGDWKGQGGEEGELDAVVARLGGDEFTVILEDLRDADAPAHVAQKLIDVLASPVEVDGQRLYVGASIGVALYPGDADGIDELLRCADLAMYESKAAGRNIFHFYSLELDSRTHRRLALESRLREAVDNEEFELHYQPKRALATGRVVSVEALLRWRDPDGRLLPPVEFVPVLEDTGLINELGGWIFRTACRQLRAWIDQGWTDLRMSINLSPRQLLQAELPQQVRGFMEKYALPPGTIELELTESGLMETSRRNVGVFDQLCQAGVRLSVDDFGTGYSSLAYLQRFPLHVLKIDQSFIGSLTRDANSRAIVQAVVALGRALELEVVAEGVETDEQENLLYGLGCDIIQGFLLSRPLAAEDFEAWLRSYREEAGRRQHYLAW